MGGGLPISDPFVTVSMRDEIERAEELSELEGLLRKYEAAFRGWPDVFRRLLAESGLTYVRLAERTGISRNTLRRWATTGGAPRCRSAYIRLGFGFRMDERRTNELLTRQGGYQPLYPRDLFDAVCIFLLERQRHTYANAEALYEQCQSQASGENGGESTAEAARQIRRILSREEFIRFTQEHGSLFQQPHERLRRHLSDLLRARGYDPVRGDSLSVHRLFTVSGIPARFEKDISNLMVHGLAPRRERLIALGLHLGLFHEELDRLLEAADMEPLCAKNRMECVLIYALQRFALAHPELTLEHAVRLLAVTDVPEQTRQIRGQIQDYLAADYHSEPEDCLDLAEQLRLLLTRLAPEDAAQLLSLI